MKVVIHWYRYKWVGEEGRRRTREIKQTSNDLARLLRVAAAVVGDDEGVLSLLSVPVEVDGVASIRQLLRSRACTRGVPFFPPLVDDTNDGNIVVTPGTDDNGDDSGDDVIWATCCKGDNCGNNSGDPPANPNTGTPERLPTIGIIAGDKWPNFLSYAYLTINKP
jgi:hypothetical protein